ADQLVLEDVQDRVGALLAVRLDLNGLLTGPGDGRAHSPEVEARADLLGRLVQRVVYFLAVDLGHNVERGFGCHGSQVKRPARGRPTCRPGDTSCRHRAVTQVLTEAPASAILHCAVTSGGARQVARVAKGSGL